MKLYFYLLFISVVFFIVGFISGFMVTIQSYFKNSHESKNRKSCHADKGCLEQPINDNNQQGNFQERMVDMEHSWSDSLENTQKFIRENLGKQDDAYNYIKNASMGIDSKNVTTCKDSMENHAVDINAGDMSETDDANITEIFEIIEEVESND